MKGLFSNTTSALTSNSGGRHSHRSWLPPSVLRRDAIPLGLIMASPDTLQSAFSSTKSALDSLLFTVKLLPE